MRVLFSESALGDLEAMLEYYREQGAADIGQGLAVDIFARVEVLIEHPDMGRVVPEFGEDHIRELIHPPFRIVYLRDTATIQIIRVWRSERLLCLPGDSPE